MAEKWKPYPWEEKRKGETMSGEYRKEYIERKKNYEKQQGDSASVLSLYALVDELVDVGDQQAKEVLVDLYQTLGLMESAFRLYISFADKTNRKVQKKLANLQGLSLSHGDRFALPRPKTEAEIAAQKQRLSYLPTFRYHPNPLATGAFEEGEARVCSCCEQETKVYYTLVPYCIENVELLCPDCIASGKAAEKYDADFVQDAEWEGEADLEKNDALFRRTPGYASWQGEYWLSCCKDYCAYLGTVGTKELRAMDIDQEVLAEYEERGEFEDVADYLVKDGSLCGYLFQCLHCGKYHLWVDAD